MERLKSINGNESCFDDSNNKRFKGVVCLTSFKLILYTNLF